tara:strand:- start:8772 stop:9284 length:513 start_codon:yes stop_codon:yes gene_type:complete
MKPVPLAMNPPTTDVTIINTITLEEAIVLSRQSARKRIIFPYHKKASDKLHRMLNVIQPGSYIRPHNHAAEGKSESVILLRGGICFMTFDASGNLISHQDLIANSLNFGVDIEPNVIHSFFALSEDTVIFEVKPGPYIKENDKGFASWAPAENTPEADLYLNDLIVKTGH